MERGKFKRLSDFKFDVIIGGGKVVEGNISCEGNIKVDCLFDGVISSRGVVFIGRKGEIQADIRCFAMIVEGKAKGRIIATNKIEVRRAGVLSGDIKCNILAMEKDSFVTGSLESIKGGKPSMKIFKESRKEILERLEG
jgi:cytoskeletal protein CcmA (bactofilin family)